MTARTYILGTIIIGGLGLATSCGDSGPECGPGTVEVEGQCVLAEDACGENATIIDGVCVGDGEGHCATGTILQNGECVPDGSVICETGTTYDPMTGTCVPDITGCAEGTVLIAGECLPYDDTLSGDVIEPPEPNGLEGPNQGMFTIPAVGASVVIEGCTQPYEDADNSGNLDPDDDVYVFSVGAPTLIEITVDGVNGLAGGALVRTATGNPASDDLWRRHVLTMVSDTAQREVFLPVAGTYSLVIGDSRSFITGEGAGGVDRCYFATVTTKALPTPTAITSGQTLGTFDRTVHFYSYSASDGDIVYSTLTTDPTHVLHSAIAALVNNAYETSSEGNPSQAPIMGLSIGDELVLAVDYAFDYGLSPVDYTLDLIVPGAQPAPGDGSTITITNDGLHFRWAFFEVNENEIVRLQFSSTSPITFAILGPGFTMITELCTDAVPCTSGEHWVQFPAQGLYYIRMYDTSFNETTGMPVSFDLTLTRTHVVPTQITIGTPLNGQTLSSYNADWYELDVSPAAADWLAFSVALTSFGGSASFSFYDRAAVGAVDRNFTSSGGATVASGAEFGRIFIDDHRNLLIRFRDSGMPTGSGTYDLSITAREYTDIGTIDDVTPYAQADIPIEGSGSELFLGRADRGYTISITAAGNAPVATVTELLSSTETTRDSAGDAVPLTTIMGSSGWFAFEVRDIAGIGGTFDLDVSGVAPVTYTVTPGALPFASICPADGGAGVIHMLTNMDEGLSVSKIALGFAFDLFGMPATELTVSSNGWITTTTGYSGTTDLSNNPIPDPAVPNSVIAPNWDDLVQNRVCVLAEANKLTIQYDGVRWATSTVVQMQAVLHDDSSIDFIYGPSHQADGQYATVGIEDSLGSFGHQIGYNTPGTCLPDTSYTLTQD